MTLDGLTDPALGAVDALPSRQRMADGVHDVLRTAILEGRLPPGSRLSVPVLAQQLDVSRSPVREAVQRLVQDGFATEEPHRGACVTRMDPAALVPLYEVREVLEGLAARLAATRASAAEVAQLEQVHRRHVRALEDGEASRHPQLDLEFHAALRAAAPHDDLHRCLEPVQGRIAIAILGGRPREWSREAIAEHEAILAAVVSGDAEAAEEAARAHIRRVRADIGALGLAPPAP